MRPRRATLVRRLSGYWRMELLNAGLVPLFVVLVAAPPSVPTLATIPANVGLLTIGGLYWRAKLQQLRGRPDTLQRLLPRIDRLQRPILLLTAVAVAAGVVAWVAPSASTGLRDRLAATVAASLAVAEYVNYFHRQLQHFDHAPDLRRLLAGRGFRRSHLAKELAAFRSATTS